MININILYFIQSIALTLQCGTCIIILIKLRALNFFNAFNFFSYHFDDKHEYSLFYSKHCSKYTRNLIIECNGLLNTNATLLVYEEFNGIIDSNIFESINFEIPVVQAITETTRMYNTLKIIQNNDQNQLKEKTKEPLNINKTNQKISNDIKSKSEKNSPKKKRAALVNNVNKSKSTKNSPKSTKLISKNDLQNNSSTNFLENSSNLYSNKSFHSSDYFVSDEDAATTITDINAFIDDIGDNLNDYDIDIFEDLGVTSNESFKNIVHLSHSILPRTPVDVENLEDNNGLHGILNINDVKIPSHQEQKSDPSIFLKYRKLFQYAGKFLRNLNYVDQGAINADILSDKLIMHSEEDERITQQGIRLYKILKSIIEKGENNEKLVKKKLEPICIWYTNKYKKYWRDNLFEKITFDDNVNEMRKDLDATKGRPIKKRELNELLKYFLDETNDDKEDENDSYYFDPVCGFDLDEHERLFYFFKNIFFLNVVDRLNLILHGIDRLFCCWKKFN